MPTRKKRPAEQKAKIKLFVLDTNVLMHDPTSLFRFEEHDIYLPIMTLEELDGHKLGMSEVSRNARQASRFIEEVVTRAKSSIVDGIFLKRHEADPAAGKLFLQTEAINGQLPANLPIGKADNHIIGVVMFLQKKHSQREVILVSKDINSRVPSSASSGESE